MDSDTKRTQKLAKVTEAGRFEVHFKIQSDGEVTYVTVENRRITFSGKLKSWKEAAEAWDRLVGKGYTRVTEL